VGSDRNYPLVGLATVENQVWAEVRLPQLLKHKAKRRFLSCEPLLGPLDLSHWIQSREFQPIDWVIAGGESGPNARAMLPSWPRKLRDQCRDANIPFHFKQWGHWIPTRKNVSSSMSFWDEVEGVNVRMEPRGKQAAGRRLDGALWDEVPAAA
jgi:protein gp37